VAILERRIESSPPPFYRAYVRQQPPPPSPARLIAAKHPGHFFHGIDVLYAETVFLFLTVLDCYERILARQGRRSFFFFSLLAVKSRRREDKSRISLDFSLVGRELHSEICDRGLQRTFFSFPFFSRSCCACTTKFFLCERPISSCQLRLRICLPAPLSGHR